MGGMENNRRLFPLTDHKVQPNEHFRTQLLYNAAPKIGDLVLSSDNSKIVLVETFDNGVPMTNGVGNYASEDI
jgi:hypothetical protein